MTARKSRLISIYTVCKGICLDLQGWKKGVTTRVFVLAKLTSFPLDRFTQSEGHIYAVIPIQKRLLHLPSKSLCSFVKRRIWYFLDIISVVDKMPRNRTVFIMAFFSVGYGCSLTVAECFALTVITLNANSANQFFYIFLIFPQNRFWHFMQVSP